MGDTVTVKVLEVDRRKRQIRLSIKAVDQQEALDQAEEEEESIPTAMEVALRKALHENAPAGEDRPAGEKGERTKDLRNPLDDILARTLEQRVKTSTGDATAESE